jgi:CubicO group peptidase (beta-lactamase class C family)
LRGTVGRVLIAFAALGGALLVLTAPFFVFTPRAPAPPDRIDSVAGLEEYLAALAANETPPAIAVTVRKDGEAVYAAAFGAADASGRAATIDTVFHFWSVTKLFTATAILQLAEDGKVDLDAPVGRYLPEFKPVTPDGEPAMVTIRQLLDHSSGMRDMAPASLFGWLHHPGEAAPGERTILRERMADYARLAREPGTAAAYSNAGYIVLGAVIEAVSGNRYEDFVRDRILSPLGMSHSDFVYRDDMLAHAATGTHPFFQFFTPILQIIHPDWFDAFVATTRRGRMWLKPIHTDYVAPTGLIGTAGDLARFGQAFLDAGALDGTRILGEAGVRAMLDEGYGANTGPDGDRMGLGWHWFDKEPLPFKGHGGDGPGFRAQLALYPDQRMVVVVIATDTLADRIGLTNLIAGVFR